MGREIQRGMTFPSLSRMRRTMNAALAALVLGGSAVPLYLDRGMSFSPVLQSQDHTGSSVAGHDHRLCIQIQANAPVASTLADPTFVDHTIQVHAPAASSTLEGLDHRLTYHSRAPPLA
jgi:hypothetical protein